HEWVTGNFVLKGENLDNNDRVFWDEATITIQKEGFPLYFVGGHRGQPFGVFNSHLISDTITKDCYEIAKTGATIGFVPGILGLDISATVHRGDTLIEHLDEAEVGAEVVIPDNDDVSSFIANITMEPAEGLLLSAYWDSEPGNDERNETLGGTVHYEFWKVTLDAEYIGATKREKTGGKEHKESAWFAAAAFQVIDPLEIAVRYGAFNDDVDGDQDGHLENRYSVGARYTLFEKDDFTTSFMLEYRKSNYENEACVTVKNTVNEVFAKLAIEF
ncbi:MAG: porin, partial [Thermodesulfobacteriota bacterium]|nr:porin [Thermodesulfobacteriota bacterium]